MFAPRSSDILADAFQPGHVYECDINGHKAYVAIHADGDEVPGIHVALGWETDAEVRHRLRQAVVPTLRLLA